MTDALIQVTNVTNLYRIGKAGNGLVLATMADRHLVVFANGRYEEVWDQSLDNPRFYSREEGFLGIEEFRVQLGTFVALAPCTLVHWRAVVMTTLSSTEVTAQQA